MKPEQLQEIIDRVYHKASTTESVGWTIDTEQLFKDMDELITALEAAQAEVERLRDENKAIEEHIAEHGVRSR